jgi:predicted TIM-barrel fold metal-dependent hydrolase
MTAQLTRRDCLKSVAAVAAATLTGCGPKTAAPIAPADERTVGPTKEKLPGYIDAHVHVWTPDTDRYPLAPGYTKEKMFPVSFTPEQLFAHTIPAHVDRINLIQMSYYHTDNSYMLDMIEKYPGTFVGTAIVDPLSPNPGAQMVELAKHKCRAFRIHPGLSKQPPKSWLRPPGYENMFAAGSTHHLAMSALIDPSALPELDRMCNLYPHTPVIIDHLCRIGVNDKVPINDQNVNALCSMAKHKNVYVKIGAFYALGKKTPPYIDLLPMIRQVVDAFSPQRCMWETDCPFQVVKHAYEDSLALIRDHADFLSKSDKAAILRATAEKLLFVD